MRTITAEQALKLFEHSRNKSPDYVGELLCDVKLSQVLTVFNALPVAKPIRHNITLMLFRLVVWFSLRVMRFDPELSLEENAARRQSL